MPTLCRKCVARAPAARAPPRCARRPAWRPEPRPQRAVDSERHELLPARSPVLPERRRRGQPLLAVGGAGREPLRIGSDRDARQVEPIRVPAGADRRVLGDEPVGMEPQRLGEHAEPRVVERQRPPRPGARARTPRPGARVPGRPPRSRDGCRAGGRSRGRARDRHRAPRHRARGRWSRRNASAPRRARPSRAATPVAARSRRGASATARPCLHHRTLCRGLRRRNDCVGGLAAQLGDPREHIATVEPVPSQPAADDGSGAADPAPAVHVDGAASLRAPRRPRPGSGSCAGSS